ncbi:hypothetical protein [Rhizobium sp. CECT 9324]|uniref:hypothetical protein n=1 Tax=Rhizobium sp. CECT 9324 TaxID=2845820 RepID=UPI001E59598F|nr:hypothetical protein [Rhizobium sp. CECT 9324]CAH0343725.1 hypothetical protein RHI9324_05462 [Rhizobium sp. CECT 9324]
MCIGGKQPEAPVNKPNYAPEDAWKHFESTKTNENGETTAITPPQDDTTKEKPTWITMVKPSQNPIRM